MYRKIFLGLTTLFVGLVSAFVIAANFSERRIVLTCKGETTIAEQSEPDTLYAALNEYRWWVGLWSDSDGSLRVESSDGMLLYYDYLKGSYPIVRIFYGDSGKLEFKGSYSKLSNSLTLVMGGAVFDGTCTVGA